METNRVVVTGVGVISALGLDHDAFWTALCEGTSGVRPLPADLTERGGTPVRFSMAAQVPDYDAEAHFDRRASMTMARFAQFGVVAAREAIADADITFGAALQPRTGVITGSSTGGHEAIEDGYVLLYKQDRPGVHPLTVPRTMANAAASHISMEYGLRGPAYTVSSACSSANHAIGQAFGMLRSGALDVAVTGGSEAPLVYGNLKAWEAMRVVAPDTCRPFSADRNGMILGEGGAVLVLETLEHARQRDARIYAEVVGFGMTADAHHLTNPDTGGPVLAMQQALDDAGCAPEQVGYINAHGTGTRANDPMETEAIRTVFGAHADTLAVSSTKSMHGHTLGAAGALEGVATVLALHHGTLPPTANYTTPDPDCDLDVVPNTARDAEVEIALSNSFAFGGLNAVLAFRAWDG